jgi:tRNA nucleotidyltransferase (CCA-adding enzyme)
MKHPKCIHCDAELQMGLRIGEWLPCFACSKQDLSKDRIQFPEEVKAIADVVTDAGGSAFLVGGSIVDFLLGIEPKDWDVEVHGLPIDTLEKTLVDAGYRVKEVGKAFGILTICDIDLEIDVSIPRVDNKMGKGHKDFAVEFDPGMTPEDAARRRDFTINAMLMNIKDGELVDPYGGYEDLERGILRITDKELFPQDPLRALRAMQLSARKAKNVLHETLTACRTMVDEFPNLARERVYEEFYKLLMKAPKPSIGLEFLRLSGWIKWFPELEALVGCPQHPEWHPEGDVWVHTCNVVDCAAILRDKVVKEEDRVAFMFSALCHDMGKPSCTDPATFKAIGHDSKGEEIVIQFMERLTNNKKLLKTVALLSANHMQPYFLSREKEDGTPLASDKAWKKLFNKMNGHFMTLGWLARADWAGSAIYGFRDVLNPAVRHAPMEYLSKWNTELAQQGEEIPKIVQGQDLIAAGLKPGVHFGERINKAYEAQLGGETNKDVLLEIALA